MLAFSNAHAAETVVTNDALIALNDLAYDGQDVVVSNSVLTVEGPHGFASLRVASGATLTHTTPPGGAIGITLTATDEPHQLTGTDLIALNNANVLIGSVIVTDTNHSVIYTNDTDYVIATDGFTFTLQRTTNSFIADGDTVLVSYNFSSSISSGLMLTVTNDFEVEPGALVTAAGRGRSGGQGTGAGTASGSPTSGAGGGHGGGGGVNSANAQPGLAYGSALPPTTLGSGGGSGTGGIGGAGGGLLQLNIGGNCVLNGVVSADGQSATNSRAGGGAGGSVWITAATISGAGQITAQGGAGEPIHGGGGGGGRIALDFQTNVFAGTISATGGAGWQRGGAGSILIRSNSTIGTVTFDNGGFAGAATLLSLTSPANLIVQGRATVTVQNLQALGSLLVRSNSTITTVPTNNATLSLNVQGDATIETGAGLTVDGRGSSANIGAGAGVFSSVVGSGAGHGGCGGSGISGANSAAGGNYFGSILSPTSLGSGGRSAGVYAGGPGGGAVRLIVNGNLQLDGKISADAAASNGNLAGGGAGGSVWLTAGTFSGAGTISANGGAGGSPGNGGGGGSGGRIAITFDTNSFTGKLQAAGGNGGGAGGAGTIYTKLNSSSYADLLVDNNGLAGTNTFWDTTFSCNLRVSGAAALRMTFSSTMSFGNLEIGTNSAFALNAIAGLPLINVTGNLTISTGGLFSADGAGYSSGGGPGFGSSSTSGSGGAGHGGYGGRGFGAAGGNVYDTSASLSSVGSGGGGNIQGPIGGAGGGGFNLTCSGNLLVDGRISANGLNGVTNGGGGGSGGSVRITVNQLSGTGTIAADGGPGHLPNGGGGGGGRIAIYYTSNSFTGTFSAKGGNGYVAGGAGTVYLKAANAPLPTLIVNNGGLLGTNTPLDLTSIQDLTVLPGVTLAMVSGNAFITIGNLTVSSNATLLFSSGNLNVSGPATIAAGGAISANGQSTSTLGSGNNGGGAGHGGYGGRGTNVIAFGGNIYDSTVNPTQSGSPSAFSSSAGSPGGGALRITVNGPLTLDGRITANGINAGTNVAGGSGGSVWLTVNNLFSGTGAVTADGASALLAGSGGGGGGGRVAVYYASSSFTGSMSAKGGNGFQAGGAGTVYVKNIFSSTPNLLVDNGGLSGTNTVLDLNSLSNLTVTGGAVLKPNSPAQNVTVTTLTIGTNSTLLTPAGGLSLTLNIIGTANIAGGGSISGDGQGSLGGSGIGFGQTATGGSGGGGHAGYGGRGLGNAPTGAGGAGGNAYDSPTTPTLIGSGGGGLSGNGGSGGGAIRINANGAATFTLNGRISANGLNVSSNNAGGGSGGSIWLTLNQLLGSGVITANGGDGHLPFGGGGGGGRISVSYNYEQKGNSITNGFTGTMAARGGNGYLGGGAGTIYVRTNNAATPVVITDNGGRRGTNTLVSASGSYDLWVQGGAMATSIGTPRDLFVQANSFLVQAGSINIARNATFAAGGGINLDGLSFITGGIGAGYTYAIPKGGGGHGGYGGQNPTVTGGAAYDTATSPSQGGGPGGNGSGTVGAPFGGAGGGAMKLTVGNVLTVNGAISANGLNGDLNSGGGAGGGLRLQATTLAGSGQITATGGNGNGLAGGGGGGRIAIYYTSNLFAGTISACGGTGGVAGGAGTIYWQDSLSNGTMLLDNCGLAGTNTPLSTAFGLGTNITVTGGAIAEFQGSIPTFSNLVVGANSFVTTRSADPNLYLALLGDLTVNTGGGIVVDGKGFIPATGPGAGATLANKGSGGGYGGAGGASSTGGGGGSTYGSATRPIDRGSGGGSYINGPGSEGGGAIRITARSMTLNGVVSANGNDGVQDDSGGGSGGSMLLSALTMQGIGAITANGGDGDPYGGGGGGGGRIAIYSPGNFLTGPYSVAGGTGAFPGNTGTVYTASSLMGFDVVGQFPSGVTANVVSQITLNFSEPVDPYSIVPSEVLIFTPAGILPASSLTFALPSPTSLQINFPTQNTPGDYRLELGTSLQSLLFTSLSQVYTGAFTLALPLISGTITDTNNQPVAGVSLQPNGGPPPTVSDNNGNYSIGVSSGWSGTITPVFDGVYFAPGSRAYGNVVTNLAGENYRMLLSISPTLDSGLTGTNLAIRWPGITDITYQLWSSTNLIDWLPVGDPLPGTNGLMEVLVPALDKPAEFLRVNASN